MIVPRLGSNRWSPLLLTLVAACQPSAREVTPGDPPYPGDAAGSADTGSAAEEAGLDAAREAPLDSPVRDAEPPIVFDHDASTAVVLRLPEPTANLPLGDDQRARLCARGRDDVVADLFCAEPAPRITSLAELLAQLKVNARAYIGSDGFSITGHSTSLSKRSVTAINPRVVFMHTESSSQPLLGVAFTRGEPVVEIVTRSRTQKELQFYLVSFSLRCSAGGHECAPGELLTAAIEQDWQSVDVYHEEDLKNTTVDCRTCHQPAGPTTPKLLRMQELQSPWTHWFDEQTRGGRALIEDFRAAHGQESYAGIPGSLIGQARGGLASAFVNIAGSRVQPNEFPTAKIEDDVERTAPGQPADNQTRGQSDTWRALYQAAQRGEAIPVPYHDVKITDPTKVATMQQAYAQYLAGTLPPSALPDIRDVLPDDPVALAEMGFTLDERLEDGALLTAACGLCHNARLDQTLSRARFHTDLGRLSADEKRIAVERLSLPGHDPLAMPPRRIHDLSDRVRERLITLLQR